MADPSSSDVRQPGSWLRRVAGVSLIVLGLFAVGTVAWAVFDAWSTNQTWNASPQAAEVARQAIEPTPIWLAPATPGPEVAAPPIEPLPTPEVAPTAPDRAAITPDVAPTPPAVPALLALAPTPTVTASADDLSLDLTDFRFLDPPEPGAHARLAFSVANHAAIPSGRVLLGISASWFEDYAIVGTGPAVSQDRTDDVGLRTFSFPPVGGNSSVAMELHVTAIGESTQAPSVKVQLESGDLIGEATPSTQAPTPRPGPVMAIDIPRLKLHSSVVQTDWEAPPFTVGQIKGSANITEGNTVLIGHLTGAAGNVFAHLDELEPGDEITAVSRGLPYSFVVARTYAGSNSDSAPIQPADDERLTLMTCAGVWNPFTHDYSQRLWIIAEPPDQAAETIAAAAATATAEATAGVAATATALALVPTATPAPTPYVGEPSLPGGLGNSRADIEKALGQASGETSGKLVVFHEAGRELHVAFTPDPARATLLAEIPAPNTRLTFDVAVRDARKFFPSDARPRAAAPEGNIQFVVERFTSPSLGLALGDEGDFSVVYTRDAQGSITSIVLGLGDDYQALLEASRR